MRITYLVLMVGGVVVLGSTCADVSAQQMTTTTRFHTLSDSFFEQNAVNWSGNYRGFNFSYGGGALAKPAFGGADPTAGLSTNFGITGPNGQINFGLNFSQGYKQSMVTQAPSVATMNGQPGTIQDESQTPFVISVVPTVGAFPLLNSIGPPGINPMNVPAERPPAGPSRVDQFLQSKAEDDAAAAGTPPTMVPAGPNQGVAAPAAKAEEVAEPAAADNRVAGAQQSSAGRAAPSVAEARRLHQLEQGNQDETLRAVLERARAAEEDGKPGVAKIYYQQVARHASGALKQQALDRLEAIRGTAGR